MQSSISSIVDQSAPPTRRRRMMKSRIKTCGSLRFLHLLRGTTEQPSSKFDRAPFGGSICLHRLQASYVTDYGKIHFHSWPRRLPDLVQSRR
ncbi:hypothetical protein A0H81_12716 [Grifola frondosa]|uniref:Uncharacterized protein n=1 Tax=Grifola frondosa TaxID=5627 RepID=A0A1C7LRU2_GRIFR|nr:hypothetical protein A0H81_12716 [Grifola frondosa]